jgi:hypothetical protein
MEVCMLKKLQSLVLLALVTLMATATQSMASLSAGDLTSIQTGITGADTSYFAIGGTILVVLAGIWGFKMVKRLF